MAAGAEEVGVDGAFAVLGVVRQEAGVAQATGGGLEVVVVEALPLAVAVGVQDVLDLLPGGGVHQRLVPAGVCSRPRAMGLAGRSSPRPVRCVAGCDTVQLPVAYWVKASRIRGARASSSATVRTSRPLSLKFVRLSPAYTR